MEVKILNREGLEYIAYSIKSSYTKEEVDSIAASKQDIIEDLDTIREGAALGATAIQEHQSLADYRKAVDQDIIDNSKANKANTLAGYSISDAYTKKEVDDNIKAIDTAYKAADKELQDAIANENQQRTTIDEYLNKAIQDEQTAREAGDAAVKAVFPVVSAGNGIAVTSNTEEGKTTYTIAADASVFQFKGYKETIEELPIEGNVTGDCYAVGEKHTLYAWDGDEWVAIGNADGIDNVDDTEHNGIKLTKTGSIVGLDVVTGSIVEGDDSIVTGGSVFTAVDTERKARVDFATHTNEAIDAIETEIGELTDDITGLTESKANKSDTYTKDEVDSLLEESGKVQDVLVNGESVLEGKDAIITLKTVGGEDIQGEGNINVNTMIEVEVLPSAEIDEKTLYKLIKDMTHIEQKAIIDPETGEPIIIEVTIVDYYSGIYCYIDGWKALYNSSESVDYNDITNKPKINGIVLNGNKTAEDLELITESDLECYQKKSDEFLATTSKTIVGAINELKAGASTVYKYKGSAATVEALPAEAEVGDSYYVEDEEATYAYNGEAFLSIGGTGDLSAYQKAEDNNLTTTDKTVIGAINELDKQLGDIDTFLATITTGGGI